MRCRAIVGLLRERAISGRLGFKLGSFLLITRHRILWNRGEMSARARTQE